jgi:hypothetical protein
MKGMPGHIGMPGNNTGLKWIHTQYNIDGEEKITEEKRREDKLR